MLKPNMTRMIIYLVVSIALIIFIFTIPDENTESTKTNSSSKKKDMITDAEIIELPTNDSLLKDGDPFEIRIDSSGAYFTNVTDVTWNELCTEIRVQKKIRPKLYLKISVNTQSKSEVLMRLMEFALKEKIKIGITKNE